jgi:hypothetical protein
MSALGRLVPVATLRSGRSTELAGRSGFERPLTRVTRSKMVAGHQRPVFPDAVVRAFDGERLTSVSNCLRWSKRAPPKRGDGPNPWSLASSALLRWNDLRC